MDWTNRVKAELKAKNLRQDDLIPIMKVKTRGAVGHYLNKRREPTGEQLSAVANFFNFKLDWLMSGRGEKYWVEQTGSFTAESSLNVNSSTKLIEIINAADKAMNDSKCEFTVDERIDYYLEALSFAGRKDFSSDFIRQYVKELLKQK